MNTLLHEFSGILVEKGIQADEIIADGLLRRCPTVKKLHKKNAAYIAWSDSRCLKHTIKALNMDTVVRLLAGSKPCFRCAKTLAPLFEVRGKKEEVPHVTVPHQ